MLWGIVANGVWDGWFIETGVGERLDLAKITSFMLLGQYQRIEAMISPADWAVCNVK